MIAFDANSHGSGGASDTTLTWSHTCTGDDRLLVVNVGESRTVIINGVTYNGVALTKARDVANWSRSAWIWYLIAPATGANNVIVTYDRAITAREAGAGSFTNAEQTTPLGATNAKTGTAPNKTQDITTQENDSVIIECIGAFVGSHTPTAGQTIIHDSANRISAYEIVGAAGLYTQTWGADVAASYTMVAAEFKGISAPSVTFVPKMTII